MLSHCQSAGLMLNREPRKVTRVGRRRDIRLATRILTRSGTLANLTEDKVEQLTLLVSAQGDLGALYLSCI